MDDIKPQLSKNVWVMVSNESKDYMGFSAWNGLNVRECDKFMRVL